MSRAPHPWILVVLALAACRGPDDYDDFCGLYTSSLFQHKGPSLKILRKGGEYFLTYKEGEKPWEEPRVLRAQEGFDDESGKALRQILGEDWEKLTPRALIGENELIVKVPKGTRLRLDEEHTLELDTGMVMLTALGPLKLTKTGDVESIEAAEGDHGIAILRPGQHVTRGAARLAFTRVACARRDGSTEPHVFLSYRFENVSEEIVITGAQKLRLVLPGDVKDEFGNKLARPLERGGSEHVNGLPRGVTCDFKELKHPLGGCSLEIRSRETELEPGDGFRDYFELAWAPPVEKATEFALEGRMAVGNDRSSVAFKFVFTRSDLANAAEADEEAAAKEFASMEGLLTVGTFAGRGWWAASEDNAQSCIMRLTYDNATRRVRGTIAWEEWRGAHAAQGVLEGVVQHEGGRWRLVLTATDYTWRDGGQVERPPWHFFRGTELRLELAGEGTELRAYGESLRRPWRGSFRTDAAQAEREAAQARERVEVDRRLRVLALRSRLLTREFARSVLAVLGRHSHDGVRITAIRCTSSKVNLDGEGKRIDAGAGGDSLFDQEVLPECEVEGTIEGATDTARAFLDYCEAIERPGLPPVRGIPMVLEKAPPATGRGFRLRFRLGEGDIDASGAGAPAVGWVETTPDLMARLVRRILGRALPGESDQALDDSTRRIVASMAADPNVGFGELRLAALGGLLEAARGAGVAVEPGLGFDAVAVIERDALLDLLVQLDAVSSVVRGAIESKAGRIGDVRVSLRDRPEHGSGFLREFPVRVELEASRDACEGILRRLERGDPLFPIRELGLARLDSISTDPGDPRAARVSPAGGCFALLITLVPCVIRTDVSLLRDLPREVPNLVVVPQGTKEDPSGWRIPWDKTLPDVRVAGDLVESTWTFLRPPPDWTFHAENDMRVAVAEEGGVRFSGNVDYKGAPRDLPCVLTHCGMELAPQTRVITGGSFQAVTVEGTIPLGCPVHFGVGILSPPRRADGKRGGIEVRRDPAGRIEVRLDGGEGEFKATKGLTYVKLDGAGWPAGKFRLRIEVEEVQGARPNLRQGYFRTLLNDQPVLRERCVTFGPAKASDPVSTVLWVEGGDGDTIPDIEVRSVTLTQRTR